MLLLLVCLSSCKTVPTDIPRSSRDVTIPDLKEYSAETQLAALEELRGLGCLPAGNKIVCETPVLYALVVDYYKTREQIRIAKREHVKAYGK